VKLALQIKRRFSARRAAQTFMEQIARSHRARERGERRVRLDRDAAPAGKIERERHVVVDRMPRADVSRFRPKVIAVEAIKPLTLAPAWDEWEPLLACHGYAYVWDDELNRYYVAEEARSLSSRLTEGPKWYAEGPQIGNYKGAAEDPAHPDHRLACLLAGADLAKLPLMDRDTLSDLLTRGVEGLDRPARAADIVAIEQCLFGSAAAQQIAPQHETIREAYRRIMDSATFRAACGRIAASYAW